MPKKNKKTLVSKAKHMMEDGNLTEALAEMIIEQRGELGFLLGMLKKRPRSFNPYVLKGLSIYKEPSSLDRKTAELVAIGAATALNCEHCLEAHIPRAIGEGATLEDIMDAILVSGAISESSALSVAFRKFLQQEGKLKRRRNKKL
jgi:AhpD family alkylhydroperoxidase